MKIWAEINAGNKVADVRAEAIWLSWIIQQQCYRAAALPLLYINCTNKGESLPLIRMYFLWKRLYILHNIATHSIFIQSSLPKNCRIGYVFAKWMTGCCDSRGASVHSCARVLLKVRDWLQFSLDISKLNMFYFIFVHSLGRWKDDKKHKYVNQFRIQHKKGFTGDFL